MTANEISNEGIFTQLAVVHTMLPKVKELIDQQQAKIESLQEHNVKLIDDLFAERKEVLKFEAEIEQLKALVISLSPNANLIYTKASEK
jgi:restriction endonuclease S subunit